MLPTQPISHIHLKSPLTSISLTDTATKLNLNTTDFEIDALGGFTFDATDKRFIWDSANNYNCDLLATFIGDAGIEVTGGEITGNIILELRVNNAIILETNLNYNQQNKVQSYGANDVLIDDTTKEPLLEQGSYWEVWARAGVGETPIVTLDYFNVTIKGR